LLTRQLEAHTFVEKCDDLTHTATNGVPLLLL